VKIPIAVRERTKNRILAHASKHYAGKYTRLDMHFRGQLCYIDAYTEPSVPPGFDPAVFGESREEYCQRLRDTPMHLCRASITASATFGHSASPDNVTGWHIMALQ